MERNSLFDRAIPWVAMGILAIVLLGAGYVLLSEMLRVPTLPTPHMSAGIPARQIVVGDWTVTDDDTVTIVVDGVTTILTEGTDFECEDQESDDACCQSLSAAVAEAGMGPIDCVSSSDSSGLAVGPITIWTRRRVCDESGKPCWWEPIDGAAEKIRGLVEGAIP